MFLSLYPELGSGDDDPISWTEPYYHAINNGGDHNSYTIVPESYWSKNPLQDMNITNYAIKTLQKVCTIECLKMKRHFFHFD